jgi:hypothetical protein
MTAKPGPRARDSQDARAGRRIALVIAGAICGWMLAQALGREYGWDPRLAILFDLAALGALGWSLVATLALWRRRGEGPAERK